MKYKMLLLAASASALLMSGCESKDGYSDLEDNVAGYAVFNPTEGKVPYPNNILFAPNSSSTNDFDGGRTLNIPYEPGDSDENITKQLNTLSGFSTISPIMAPVTATLDEATFPAGVQVYEASIDPTSGAVTAINASLVFGVDFVVTQSGSNIIIVPLQPLKSLTTYVVVLTDALKDAAGRPLAPDVPTALTLSDVPVEAGGALDASTAAGLEMIRQGNQAMFAALKADGKDTDNTVQMWNFRTQAIGAVLNSMTQQVSGNAQISLHMMPMTTKDLGAGIAGTAQVYDGNISGMPQYMPQATPQDPTAVIRGTFAYSAPFVPEVNATVTLPLVATVPNATSGCTEPTDGWPVVIYQHGITRVRTDLFVYGETLAMACYVGIAMDLPLHGVTETNTSRNPFYKAGIERTFDVDILTESPDGNVTPGPDGSIDSSGANYMNLAHIITTRDNLHQSTSDLLELQSAIGSATGLHLNPDKIAFLSHSLGNIAATGYIATTSEVKAAVMMMPGQGVVQLLVNSPVFSPAINKGLESVGIETGSAKYQQFMLALQTLVDDADPANYSASIGASSVPILEIEAVGDGTEGSGDQHIPNSVATAPLSGTEPFIRFTTATDINTTGLAAGDTFMTTHNKTVARLTAGEHRSPLDPQYSMSAFNEIHTELISFIASDGAAIRLADPSIIKQ